jgi:hypothetical protein
MRKQITKLLCFAFSVFVAAAALGETYAVQYRKNERKLQVVRHYEIAAEVGKPIRVFVPAMMSFWGATNWQLVEKTDFTYSEPPDDIKITADDLGMPRRNYQLTWKSPKANKIAVDETLEVVLMCGNKLYTKAKLPYSDEVRKRFSASLGKDEKEGINPDNKELEPLCARFLERAHGAEATVECVCDWIDENIHFEKGQRTSDQALAEKRGSCTPMSRLACAMLRHIGMPAEVVGAKFIDHPSGHGFIEVYFPDAGWVFYDLSNWSRGFKSLDCLAATGFAYRVMTREDNRWFSGYFCEEKDEGPFREEFAKAPKLIRKTPNGAKVASVTVIPQNPPSAIKPRTRPLRELILDTEIPPGPREYTDGELTQ